MRLWNINVKNILRQRLGVCTVDGCTEPKGVDLRFLCDNHHCNASDVPEMKIGNLASPHFKMEERKAEWNKDHERLHATVLTAENHTQFELEYYLEHGALPTECSV
jgi:hypothetical protein